MKECPNCGCENKDSSKFCIECGKPFKTQGSRKAKPAKSKKEKLTEILEEYKYSINKTEYSCYVPFEKMGARKENLLKFDGNLDFDAVIGLFDISVNLSLKDIWSGSMQKTVCKEGLLFTLSGFYDHTGPFSGSHYIRYSDIQSMEVEDKKNGNLIINGEYSILGSFYWTDSLKEMLEKICKINEKEKSYTEVLESGKRSGVASARMRKYGHERELIAYQRCSREYEIKLRRQADLFLQETNRWKSKRKEYEALLDEYEATIAELEDAVAQNGSSEYKERLSSVKEYKDRLESLGN